MKKIILLFAFSVATLCYGQTPDKLYSEKVTTLDSTIETLYDVISGEKDKSRNWELFKYLFRPEAKLIPSSNNRQGVVGIRYMTATEYIDTSGKWLEENGFFEKEIHRETQTFGNIAQVFSTYESYFSEKDSTPFARGINSIQLFNDGSRWWIVNIFWSGETEENPIPEQYLPKN